jgi:nucleotide-binding universal stress UspA family protein
MVEIREILYPTDFSEASRHALEHALVIAKWYGSRLAALHVIHVPLLPQPPIFGAAFADAPTPASSDHQERQEELRVWLEPARHAGIETDLLVDEGTPHAGFSSMRARARPI